MRSEISKSLVVSSSGDKMTSSPTEMRTTPKRAKSQTKADDDADKERLPQRQRSREHQQVPTAATPTRATISDYVHGWTTPRQSGYLYTIASIRAWVDDADNERLPPRHRIRPRERIPAKQNCPREHISDKNFSNSSPLLLRGLLRVMKAEEELVEA